MSLFALTGAVIAVSVAVLSSSQPERPNVDHAAELKNPDGSWKYTNELAESSSPYLLQHAHNPVDWREWNDTTIALAKAQEKPIFLSVGYSTCYWCHVMKREVFSDPAIAAIMNERFINIKVDREVRPDIDEIYMTATQLMTQSGGWPNSLFLTPDLKPFFSGTYFPPEDIGNRPGFPRVLNAIADAWRDERDNVLAVSERAASAIQQVLTRRFDTGGAIPAGLSERAVAGLAQNYDERDGGFGLAPKFPQGFYFPFLFDVSDRTKDAHTLDMAIATLRKMAAGGVYDHVGGGFHRYSTDAQWLVPHFEKMLYNQAQLAIAYTEAFARTREPADADIVRGTLRFVSEKMTGPEGGFYSAIDAETDAVEGGTYAWNIEEIRGILPKEEFAFFQKTFDIAAIPRFPGHKYPDGGALHLRAPALELASRLELDTTALRSRLNEVLAPLKAHRDRRPKPRLDDKVIAAWNGLMIAAFARAGEQLEEPEYVDRARKAAAFILEHLRDADGRLQRSWRNGSADLAAFQEDYAFLIQGLAALHRASGEQRWLDAAIELAEITERDFGREEGGGYFFSQENPQLLSRSANAHDSAMPSGNSAMANALLDLAEATGDAKWRHRAERAILAFSQLLAQSPLSSLHMTHAAERFNHPKSKAEPPAKEPAVTVAPLLRPDQGATADSGALDSARHVKVDVSAPATVHPGESFAVRITLHVDEGWHVNANPASDPALIPTSADVRSDTSITISSIEYPDAAMLRATYAPAPIRVYEGDIEILVYATLDDAVTPRTSVSLRTLTRFQACDEGRCLKPADTITLSTVAVLAP